MGKFVIGLVIGLIAGGAAICLGLVGVPRSTKTPGAPIRPPDAQAAPMPAQIVLKQELFNAVLQSIFRDMQPPAFPLQAAGEKADQPRYQYLAFQQGQCDGMIRVLPQGSGVNTGVAFENGRIEAVLAFSGSYNSAIGCFPFTGSAKANLELRFDSEQQAVFGRLNVDSVDLDGVNPLLNGLVTPLVQSSINSRVNPIQILRPEQLNVEVPVSSANGKLKVHVSDIRAEVKGDALTLFVAYDFSGAQAQGGT